MAAATFRSERDGDVLVVTLDRAHKRNALDDATVGGVAELVHAPEPGVRTVVLAAEGEHFCAGLDLNEIKATNAFETAQSSRRWHRWMEQIQYGPVPVVAALHGAVIGGGLEVAASAHIRVADSSAFYALPEGARGIFVGGGGSSRLPRLIGTARMTDMMLTGRVLDAEEGQRIGLTHYLVGQGDSLVKAMELAHKIAANTGLTNYAVTNVLPRIADASADVGLMMESLTASLAASDTEAKTRLADFLEGRAERVRREQ